MIISVSNKLDWFYLLEQLSQQRKMVKILIQMGSIVSSFRSGLFSHFKIKFKATNNISIHWCVKFRRHLFIPT